MSPSCCALLHSVATTCRGGSSPSTACPTSTWRRRDRAARRTGSLREGLRARAARRSTRCRRRGRDPVDHARDPFDPHREALAACRSCAPTRSVPRRSWYRARTGSSCRQETSSSLPTPCVTGRRPTLLERLREGCAEARRHPIARPAGGRSRALVVPAGVDQARAIPVTKTGATDPGAHERPPRSIRPCDESCGRAASPARRCAIELGCRRRRSGCSACGRTSCTTAIRRCSSSWSGRRALRVPGARHPRVQFLDVLACARSAGGPRAVRRRRSDLRSGHRGEIPALQILSSCAKPRWWLQGVGATARRWSTATAFYIGSTRANSCGTRRRSRDFPAQFDNGVGILLGRLSDRAREARQPVRSASATSAARSPTIEDWFSRASRPSSRCSTGIPRSSCGSAVICRESPALERFGGTGRRHPVQPWTSLPDVLHQLDVNLAPSNPGSRFNEAKSAIKWLEAALVATPTIASSTEPFGTRLSRERADSLPRSRRLDANPLDLLLTDRRDNAADGRAGPARGVAALVAPSAGPRSLRAPGGGADWPALAAGFARRMAGWTPSRTSPWSQACSTGTARHVRGAGTYLDLQRSLELVGSRRVHAGASASGGATLNDRARRPVRRATDLDGCARRCAHRARRSGGRTTALHDHHGARTGRDPHRRSRRTVRRQARPRPRPACCSSRASVRPWRPTGDCSAGIENTHGVGGTVELGRPVARHAVFGTVRGAAIPRPHPRAPRLAVGRGAR